MEGDGEIRDRAHFPLILPAEALQSVGGRMRTQARRPAVHARAPAPLALQQLRPEDLTIRRLVGEFGFATATEWLYGGESPSNPLDPDTPKRTMEMSGTTIRLFDGQLGGARVLLKEYLGEAKEMGEVEQEIYSLLSERASGPDAVRPLQELLGRLDADETFASAEFRAAWAAALPTTLPPSTKGLWLAFRWAPLRTVGGFASSPQERGWFDFDGRMATAQRRGFVKRVCRACMEAVAWMHGQGVVHRSLGSDSLLLSTYDPQEQAPRVTITNLGFATTATRVTPEQVTAAMERGAQGPLDVIPFLTRIDDLYALAYVFLDLALGGGEKRTDWESLKRLVEDVFQGDVRALRDYLAAESEYADGIRMLDEDGGWALIDVLVDCGVRPGSELVRNVTALSLLDSPWLAV